MTGCAAINCSRHSKTGTRMFRFPRSPRRSAKWLQNTRRAQWTPKSSSRLCEVHFEDSQYENCDPGENGFRKLRRTAVPTLFNVPNPPKPLTIKRKRTADEMEALPVGYHRPTTSQNDEDHCYFKRRNISNAHQSEYFSEYFNTGGEGTSRASTETTTSIHDIATPGCSKMGGGEGTSRASTETTTSIHDIATPGCSKMGGGEGTSRASTETTTSIHDIATPGCSQNNMEKRQMQKHIWRLQKQLTKSRKEVTNLKEKLDRSLNFLGEKQRLCLLNGKKVFEYSPECIKEALQVRYAVGWKGYKFLVQRGYPLPSYSTICRRLQTADFMPGMLTDILSCLKIKASSCSVKERDCVLQIDEMEVSKGVELVPGFKRYVGNCTLGPDHVKKELASQLLVVMIRGINTNWKQVVGYHLLTKTNEDSSFSDFVKEAVVAVEEVGYKVHGIVSDMGPKNQGMWRSLGLGAGRWCRTFDVAHPANNLERRLHVFADVPHLLKNIKQAMISHDITIPKEIVDKNRLPHDKVEVKYLKALVRIQKDKCLKLAPNITERHFEPNQFEKMKVSMATQLFSVTTASALETLVKLDYISKKALATAWFLREVRAWFDILNSRRRKSAITRKNRFWKIKVLRGKIELFRGIKFGDGRWKPIQTGVILTTENIINLVRELFSEGYAYVLTSRMNQDALENLFSILRRHGNVHPSSLQAIQALKLITLSQFVEQRGGQSQNYEDDQGEHYVALFSKRTPIVHPNSVVNNVNHCVEDSDNSSDEEDVNCSQYSGCVLEDNSLNHVLGGVIKTVRSRNQFCSTDCEELFKGNKSEGRSEEILITAQSKGGLIYPKEDMFHLIKEAEAETAYHLKRCQRHTQLLQHIETRICQRLGNEVIAALLCTEKCNAFCAVIKQYIRVRLHIHSSIMKEQAKVLNRKKTFSSRSAYMHDCI